VQKSSDFGSISSRCIVLVVLGLQFVLIVQLITYSVTSTTLDPHEGDALSSASATFKLHRPSARFTRVATTLGLAVGAEFEVVLRNTPAVLVVNPMLGFVASCRRALSATLHTHTEINN
jgi:hypothetical protein